MYLSPYKQTAFDTWARMDIDGHTFQIYAKVGHLDYGFYFYWLGISGPALFEYREQNTLQSAQDELDTLLRQENFILLSQEEFDKMSLLA